MDQPEPTELPSIFAVPAYDGAMPRPVDHDGVWPPRPMAPTIDRVSMPITVQSRVAGGGTISRMRGPGQLALDNAGIAVSGRSVLPVQYVSALVLIGCIYFLPRGWFLPAYLVVVALRFILILPAKFIIPWENVSQVLIQPGKPWASINYLQPSRWSSQRMVSLCCSMTENDLQTLRLSAETMAPGRVVPGILKVPAYVFIVIVVAVVLIAEQFMAIR